MRYALISDIHSNLEALEAFFDVAGRLGVDRTVCLGDLVGYNANPNECIELLREKKVRCIAGNHDTRVAGLEDLSDFNLMAAEAVEWTRKVITEENRKFLEKLPRKLHFDSLFLAVHGWINDTDRYIFGADDARQNFELLKKARGINICFFGHTHVPITYIGSGQKVKLSFETQVRFEEVQYYLVNPGALGQPRDKDPRGSFIIYDTEKGEAVLHRVEYDVNTTAAKIIEAGLSPRLAERLKLGW